MQSQEIESVILSIANNSVYQFFNILLFIYTIISLVLCFVNFFMKREGKKSKSIPMIPKGWGVLIPILLLILNVIILLGSYNMLSNRNYELRIEVEENRKYSENISNELTQTQVILEDTQELLAQTQEDLWRTQTEFTELQSIHSDLLSYNDELLSRISPGERPVFIRNPEDLNQLHPSLHVFIRPFAIFETNEYMIRIDVMANNGYRYAQWEKGIPMIEWPDFTLRGLSAERDYGKYGEYGDRREANQIMLTFWEGTAATREYTIIFSRNDSENKLITSYSGAREVHEIINIIYRGF